MAKEIAPVHSFNVQLEAVGRVQNLETYFDFHQTYFSDGSKKTSWIEKVAEGVQNLDPKVGLGEYYKLLAMVGVLTAQYGYPQQVGQFYRHTKEGNDYAKPMTDPVHVVEVAGHMARLNKSAIPVKEGLHDAVLPYRADIAIAAWGISFGRDGEVVKSDILSASPSEQQSAVSTRAYSERPVCLTDSEVIANIAAIKISAREADIVSPQGFRDSFYPQVRVAFPNLNTDAIFLQ